MPKNFMYLGHAVNLGRFGFVKRGDIVNLTDQEEASIMADPANRGRFQIHNEGDKPVEGAGLDVPDNFHTLRKPDQATLLRKLADDKRRQEEAEASAVGPRSGAEVPERDNEAVRKANLNKANDETEKEQLRNMTKDELLQHAADLNKSEKANLTFQKNASKLTVLKAIYAYKGFDDTALESDEEP